MTHLDRSRVLVLQPRIYRHHQSADQHLSSLLQLVLTINIVTNMLKFFYELRKIPDSSNQELKLVYLKIIDTKFNQ